MLDFAEAMLLTHDEIEPFNSGTLYIMPEGYEDARSYCVFTDVREWVIDHDPNFNIMDMPIVFVDKETGETTRAAYTSEWSRLAHMKPVRLTRTQLAQFTADLDASM